MERMAGDAAALVTAAIKAAATSAEGKVDLGWYERQSAIPGNAFILPDQRTQHRRGEADLEWQYPFFRQDLVKAGLLPERAPSVGAERIKIPTGMSVFEAIKVGLIR